MTCPVCERVGLLIFLSENPTNDEVRLRLAKLLHCEEKFITSGVDLVGERMSICTNHSVFENYEEFLIMLNSEEVVNLIFGGLATVQ